MAITLKETRRASEDTYETISYAIVLDGATVGAACVMASDTGVYVDGIAIDEAHRNNGYGTAALVLLSEMHGGIYLAPDSADAQRLYERIGYEYTGDDAAYVDQGYGVYAI